MKIEITGRDWELLQEACRVLRATVYDLDLSGGDELGAALDDLVERIGVQVSATRVAEPESLDDFAKRVGNYF